MLTIAVDPITRTIYDNGKQLATELGQVEHAIHLLTSTSDVSAETLAKARLERPEKIKNYLHHQG